jgi:methanogenic corrinoid protein MtbC1
MAALVIALRGYRVLYLGTDTPVEQIAATIRGGDADIVALSISSTFPRARALASVEALRKLLPARALLWMGGAGAPVEGAEGVERLTTLQSLDERAALLPA